MITRILTVIASLMLLGCQTSPEKVSAESPTKTTKQKLAVVDDINPPPDVVPQVGTKTDKDAEYWRKQLTSEQFRILREKGTERAGSGGYNKHDEKGTYHCSGCNAPLYESSTKFDSGTGWPSYHTALEGRVGRVPDNSYGMKRVELVCSHCDGHLGHVFEDGPAPTGERHCINSVSLYFRPE